jgi:hypothetical protein
MVEIQQVDDEPTPTKGAESSEWQELMGKDLMLKVSECYEWVEGRFSSRLFRLHVDSTQHTTIE